MLDGKKIGTKQSSGLRIYALTAKDAISSYSSSNNDYIYVAKINKLYLHLRNMFQELIAVEDLL